MTKEFLRLIKPLVVLFFALTLVLLALSAPLDTIQANVWVVISANTLLFLVSILNLFFQFKQISNPNPNVVIRGIMAGMFIKLFGLGAAVLIYLIASGSSRSINAVFMGMGLYIVYTWVEVRISLRLNPKK